MSRFSHLIGSSMIVVLATAALPAVAADHTVLQANKTFVDGSTPKDKLDAILKDEAAAKAATLETITVKKGDTIVFTNGDTVTHHVFTSNFNEKQEPGQSSKITFSDTGDVIVRCAIHPKMKLMVKVTD
ncbi:MAG TPA: hypothetical protein VL588_09100 [Bdellovibrionota bacterium]|jgi:plastocyanin|nr:hypothetical protein [Bdellovibrionota bacterium]